MFWKKAFAFALVVTLAGMALDIMIHLLTGVVVHFNYVIEKTFVVGLALFLFSWWIGADWKHGIGFVFIASSLFYVYYLLAVPTLDRAVFTLDEQIKWVFVHFVVIYLPYLTGLSILDKSLSARPVISNRNLLLVTILGSSLFALMSFPGVSFIVDNNLVIGRTYNDHIAISIVLLTLGIVACYRLLKSKTPQ